jgi:DNA modification methylase
MNIPLNKISMEYWPTAKLIPYARNPRKNDHALERMSASICEFGFKIPILVRSSGEVIDGHLRLKAGQKLGLAEFPVIVCDEWTPAQVKAFRLLVNRSASWAEWDEDLLTLEFADLQDLDFDLKLTGFDTGEIDDFLGGSAAEDRDLDTVPEVPAQAVTAPGDLWLCGNHRVLCGDATNRHNVGRLLGPAAPLLMITDPPYGVDYDPQWRERAGLGKLRQTGKVTQDDRRDWTEAYGLFPGDVAYVWHAGIYAVEVAQGLESSKFEIRGQIIWAKQHFALSRGHYHWQHEPCWYAVRQGSNAHWCGDRSQSTLWQVSNLNPFGGHGDSSEMATGHGTQKPVEIMRRPIVNHTARGGTVYDPFLGSGTVLIAAELTDRACSGLEIEPRYVDMIVCRWQQMSGQQAVLEGDGRCFDQVQAERLSTTEAHSKDIEHG